MRKRTAFSFVTFAALLGLVMTTVFKPQERNLTHLSVASIDADTVDKIVLQSDETFQLLKEGERWVLDDGRPADPDMIDRALGSVASLTSTELVSSNPEKHAPYEVDDENGQRVTVFIQSQPVVDLVIGRSSMLGGGTYVRVADTNDVYLVQRTPIKSYFSSSKAEWQRLKMFDASLEDVSGLKIVARDGVEIDLVQGEDNEWALRDMSVLPAGFRFDTATGQSFISEFLELRAKEILLMSPDPDASGLGVDGNVATYALTLQSGVTHTLRVGKIDVDDQNHYAQLDDDQLLLIPAFAADNIQKPLSDFRTLDVMEFDPNTVTRLSIISQTEQRVFEKADGQWAVAGDSANPPEGVVLDSETVDQSIQELSHLRATSYLEDPPLSAENGFGKPSFEIMLTLQSGDTATLLLGAYIKDGTQTVYYVRGNADNGTYLVPEHEVAQFTASGFDRWE